MTPAPLESHRPPLDNQAGKSAHLSTADRRRKSPYSGGADRPRLPRTPEPGQSSGELDTPDRLRADVESLVGMRVRGLRYD